MREQAGRDRSYRLEVDDILEFEQRHGRIQPGTIVLLQTGWSRYWPDRKQYLGSESLEDASGLDFPSYGAEAARLLVEERRVALLGVDTASIDAGRSKDFLVHRIAAAANVGGLENLTGLDQLPEAGLQRHRAADEDPRRVGWSGARHRARATLTLLGESAPPRSASAISWPMIFAWARTETVNARNDPKSLVAARLVM